MANLRYIWFGYFALSQLLSLVSPISSSLYTKVRVDGGEFVCSTRATNYMTLQDTSGLSTLMYCSTSCAREENCHLFRSVGNTCLFYAFPLPVEEPCAGGTEGKVAYTSASGVINLSELALYKPVSYSTTVDNHISPFSDLIGNEGSTNDPVVKTKDATSAGELEALEFKAYAWGRYVTVEQLDSGYFCLCKIQVYGF